MSLRSMVVMGVSCLALDEQQPLQCQRPWSIYLNVVAPVCLCVAAALCHVNLSAYHSYRCTIRFTSNIVGEASVYFVGWPVTYAASLSASPFLWPPNVLEVGLGSLLVDLFVAAILIISSVIVVCSCCVRHERKWRFSFSVAAMFATEIAVLSAILALDRMYGWAALAHASQKGVYSGVYTDLPAYPWYDQMAISIGIVCAVHLVFAALRQLLRLSIGTDK